MNRNIIDEFITEKGKCFVICAAAYLFLDLPFRSMGFLNLLPLAGPKNTLPMVLGIVFGPTGALGMAAGALISGRLSGTPWSASAAEALASLLAALLFYYGWHFRHKSSASRTNLKTLKNMTRFFSLGTGAGLVMGGAEDLVLCGRYGTDFGVILLEVGLSASVWMVLIGMPVFILLTSVFALQTPAPRRAFEAGGNGRSHAPREGGGDGEAAPDFAMEIGADVEELGGVGDAVMQYIADRGILVQRGYAIMSCVEEMSVLIQKRLPKNGQIHINILSGNNVVVRLKYPGGRYNPFSVRVVPGGPAANLEILGILMVREMAVNIRYRRRGGENELTIVV